MRTSACNHGDNEDCGLCRNWNLGATAGSPRACGPTHHHACDCREARVAKLVEALEACYEMACENKWASTARISVVARAALDEWRRA